jgi:hypothetical protein
MIYCRHFCFERNFHLIYRVREIIQDYTPKDGILNYDIRRIVLRELCQLIYQPVWGSIEEEYGTMVCEFYSIILVLLFTFSIIISTMSIMLFVPNVKFIFQLT